MASIPAGWALVAVLVIGVMAYGQGLKDGRSGDRP